MFKMVFIIFMRERGTGLTGEKHIQTKKTHILLQMKDNYIEISCDFMKTVI